MDGKNVNIVAGQDLISVGTQFKGTDSLRVEGQDTSTFYAATDVHQSTTTVQSTTRLSGLAAVGDHLGLSDMLPLEKKESTDALATSTSIGSKLLSDQKIEVGVGNRTELRGTDVEAPQIAFIQTDPNKAGELILGGSISTTQTAHTERTETGGVYQEMKGNGSTVETLNQTSLKSNVNFDAALKIKLTIKIASTGGAVISDAATTLALRSAAVFDGLDAAGQARWLSQTSSWRTATSELAQMELETGAKSHPLLRHGDQVELAQLKERALTGVTPDGVTGKAVDSTRWLNNEDMLAAVKQAQARYAVGDFGTGSANTPRYEISTGKIIGDGYYKNSAAYGTSTTATVALDAKGLPITAFPKLP